MTRFLKVTLIAAAAAVAIGSPAFAQNYLNEMGTGDLHPIINQAYSRSSAPSWTFASERHYDRGARSYASTRHHNRDSWGFVASPYNGQRAYAMAGHRNPNHPALTGGGSIGYNANLLTF